MRIELPEESQQPDVMKWIDSTRMDFFGRLLPGRQRAIAFVSDRSGSYEISVCESDGSNPVQLTFLSGRMLSAGEFGTEPKLDGEFGDGAQTRGGDRRGGDRGQLPISLFLSRIGPCDWDFGEDSFFALGRSGSGKAAKALTWGDLGSKPS